MKEPTLTPLEALKALCRTIARFPGLNSDTEDVIRWMFDMKDLYHFHIRKALQAPDAKNYRYVDVEFEKKAFEALAFYADPATYAAISFLADPPCGELMEDFDDTYMGHKPGKRAREAFGLRLR